MTQKKFSIYRLITVMLLAGVVSASIVAENYIIPFVAMATALIVMQVIKKKVTEVIEDERDYEIGGKAARYAISVFGLTTSIIIIASFSLRGKAPEFQLIGSVLSYSVCALLLLYSFLFKYFSKKGSDEKSRLLVWLVVFVVFFVGSVALMRLISGEDGWICDNGEWVKHGAPTAPAPTSPCE